MTVNELAAKVGKSRSYVYQRMKLAELCPEARQAFYDGKLTPSTALLIARIPGVADQVTAIGLVVDHDDSPLPFRRASWALQNRLMLDLARAPFPPEDIDLVPAAGACSACPKRTGSQPELFHDIADGDHCTDMACFNAKREACIARQLATLAAQGAKTLTGKEAEKAFPNGGYSNSDPKGFLSLDPQVYTEGVRHPLFEILPNDREGLEIVTIEHPRTKQLIPAVRINTQLADALAAKGVAHALPMTSSGKSENTKTAEMKAKVERTARLRVYASVRASILGLGITRIASEFERRLALRRHFQRQMTETQKKLARLWELEVDTTGLDAWKVTSAIITAAEQYLDSLPLDLVDLHHLDLAVIESLYVPSGYATPDPTDLHRLAADHGVDMKLIGAAVKKELTPKPKTKAKTAAKPAKRKAKEADDAAAQERP